MPAVLRPVAGCQWPVASGQWPVCDLEVIGFLVALKPFDYARHSPRTPAILDRLATGKSLATDHHRLATGHGGKPMRATYT